MFYKDKIKRLRTSSMKATKMYIAVFLFQALIITANCCSDGWIQHGSSCYHFSADSKDWVESMVICQLFGGELVSIQSDLEEQFVVNQLKTLNSDSHYFWLGGTDLMIEGEWVWAKSRERITKGYWYPGQPNSARGENCLAIDANSNYQWVDYACVNRAYYVCENLAGNQHQEILG